MFFRKRSPEEKANKISRKHGKDVVSDYEKVKTNRLLTEDSLQPSRTTVQRNTSDFKNSQPIDNNDGFNKIVSHLKTKLQNNRQDFDNQTPTSRGSWVNLETSTTTKDDNISRDTQSYLENQNTKVLLADDLNSMMQQFYNIEDETQIGSDDNITKTQPINKSHEEVQIKTRNLINDKGEVLINNIKNIDLNDANVRSNHTTNVKTFTTGLPADTNFDAYIRVDEQKTDLRIRKTNKREI